MSVEITPATAEAFDFEWCYHILPGGQGVKFGFFEGTHTYRVEDPWTKKCFDVPSVTQVLDAHGLGVDYSAVPAWQLERKRVIGSYVHKAIHLHQLDDLDVDSLDPEIAGYFSAYPRFLAESGFKVLHTERRVVGWCNGLWWCGTIDIVGEWQGCDWILDVKCMDTLYPAHELQTAGYALTLPKPARPPFRWKRATLHLRRDGSYAPPKPHVNPNDAPTFLNALALEWERRRRKF